MRCGGDLSTSFNSAKLLKDLISGLCDGVLCLSMLMIQREENDAPPQPIPLGLDRNDMISRPLHDPRSCTYRTINRSEQPDE